MPQTAQPVMLTGGGAAAVLPTADLQTFYRNPRRGDVSQIARSLDRNGQYRPIVVNQGTETGRALEVLAGNHTLLAARHLGWDSIQAWVVDVDEEAAARIVAADNRTADLGSYDEAALVELLQGAGDLEGTGYTDEDLLDLLKRTAAPAEKQAPEEFPSYDEDTIQTEHQCPRCGYQWSGKSS